MATRAGALGPIGVRRSGGRRAACRTSAGRAGAEQEEIARAIHAVAAGEAIFGPGVAQRVLGFFSAPPPSAADPFPELTARERQILDLLAAGLANAAIANRLGVAAKTVANNVSSIFLKLQVADRAQAIVRGRDAGLGRT